MRLVLVILSAFALYFSSPSAYAISDGSLNEVAQLSQSQISERADPILHVKGKARVRPRGICYIGGCCDYPGTQEICYLDEEGACVDCFCESSHTCGGDGQVRNHTPIRSPRRR